MLLTNSNKVLSENQVVYDSAVPMNVAVKINVSVSEHMIHNGSVFAHVYFSRGLSSGNGIPFIMINIAPLIV